MVARLLILTMLSLLFFAGTAQSLSKKYEKVLIKVSNQKAVFFVTNPVRFADTSGQITSVKSIVELENVYMKKIAKKYGKSLIPDLVILLDDANRDWAANLLLYSITQSSAVTLKGYNTGNIETWRRIKKSDDIKKWREYLKSNL